jgi:hypothetical protein
MGASAGAVPCSQFCLELPLERRSALPWQARLEGGAGAGGFQARECGHEDAAGVVPRSTA